MKMKNSLKAIALASAFTLASLTPLFAQEAQPPQEKPQRPEAAGTVSGQDPQEKQDEQKKDEAAKTSSAGADRLEPDDTNRLPADVLPEVRAGRRGQLSEEEAAVVPYYNNFLTTYHLGPEDVISINVFGQDRYTKTGIVVPPDGLISYYLIPEGISVAGKTIPQLQDELTKRLDEYIIDPKVTVTLDKAVSATFSVVGDVARPGIMTMTRRYSITEALALAGGVLDTGDKAKIVILRQQADGRPGPIFVNVKDIERGRAKEMAFLVPGDQVIVPGNRLKTFRNVMSMLQVVSFARIFSGW